MRLTVRALAKVRLAGPAANAAPPTQRNVLLAFGLVGFVGAAYAYTVTRMMSQGELANVAGEIEQFRTPAAQPAALK